MSWHLQQINKANGIVTVAGEYVAGDHTTPKATAPAAPVAGQLFVSVYNNQHHFSYVDANGNIQDVWWDGGAWHLQQINKANGIVTVTGEYVAASNAIAGVAGQLFVSVYDDQHHFSYVDANGNIQDVWWGGGAWHLQQINKANGITTVKGEYVAGDHTKPNPTAPAVLEEGLFVSAYNNQHHFAYLDADGNIQDMWWDGAGWHLQQINKAFGAVSVNGEYVAGDHTTPIATAPVVSGGASFPRRSVFVSVYNNQQHFIYVDNVSNLQDVWWGGGWNLQQINNSFQTPTIGGEYVASPEAHAAVAGEFFVSVYNNQQHFTYRDVNGNLQDVWYE